MLSRTNAHVAARQIIDIQKVFITSNRIEHVFHVNYARAYRLMHVSLCD